MKSNLRIKALSASVAFFSLSVAAAEDFGYQCTNLNVEADRHIQVAYLSDINSVPCEVRYYKGDQMRVLWTSDNTAGYCESKAESFVQKQIAWGWQCDSVEYEKDLKKQG